MPAARHIYVGVMALAGVALALASMRWPVINDGPVPPLMSLLAISAIVDVAIMSRAMSGKAEPLQMNARVIGFLAGAVIYFLLRMAIAG